LVADYLQQQLCGELMGDNILWFSKGIIFGAILGPSLIRMVLDNPSIVLFWQSSTNAIELLSLVAVNIACAYLSVIVIWPVASRLGPMGTKATGAPLVGHTIEWICFIVGAAPISLLQITIVKRLPSILLSISGGTN
jgi:hypothetical protein